MPPSKEFPVCENDPELRSLATDVTLRQHEVKDLGSDRFHHFSKWSSLRRAIASFIVRIREMKFRSNSGQDNSANDARQDSNQPKRITLPRAPSAAELMCAEIIMIVQAEFFDTEIGTLSTPPSTDFHLSAYCDDKLKKSRTYRLDPFLLNIWQTYQRTQQTPHLPSPT